MHIAITADDRPLCEGDGPTTDDPTEATCEPCILAYRNHDAALPPGAWTIRLTHRDDQGDPSHISRHQETWPDRAGAAYELGDIIDGLIEAADPPLTSQEILYMLRAASNAAATGRYDLGDTLWEVVASDDPSLAMVPHFSLERPRDDDPRQ